MKRAVLITLCAMLASAILSGCVCDGTETTFKEVDEKYDGPFMSVLMWFPPMHIFKRIDYGMVLRKKPDTDTYEVLRWQNESFFSPWGPPCHP